MLREWVDKNKLRNTIAGNENAIEYLEDNIHLICDNSIFGNINAVHLVLKYINKLWFFMLCCNKNAVHFIRNHPQYLDYKTLSRFEHGIEFIEELIKNRKIHRIDWRELSKNPAAIHILKENKYYKYIDWKHIIYNKNAACIVKSNLNKMGNYWYDICKQAHLIEIIEDNFEKINWYGLSENDKAIHILIHNMDKIDIHGLFRNKNSFELLLTCEHHFTNDNHYHKNIVFEYFNYCEKYNIPFTLINGLAEYGYTEKHMEYLKNNKKDIDYYYLSINPNIFTYDYKKMRVIRNELSWYNDIQHRFL
jgi:hypothetical protein